MELGTVISTFDSPTTNKFSFVISSPNAVRKGKFIQLNSEEGLLFAFVQGIVRSNRYFERAESVSEYVKKSEEGNNSFLENFPANEWEFAVAECCVLGAVDSGSLKRSSFPAAPGTKVHDADLQILKEFLGFQENGLKMGKLMQHNLDVKLDLTRLLQKHLAILAMSGAGKSVTASVLIEELLSRKKEDGRIAIVVFDMHGEYKCFADKRNNIEFAEKTEVVSAEKIKIGARHLTPQMLSMLLPTVSSTQLRVIRKILQDLKKKAHDTQEDFSLEDIANAVSASGEKENVVGPLLGWLGELESLKLFAKSDFPKMKQCLKSGKLLVIDLSPLTNLKKKQAIVAYLSEKMFGLRMKQEVPPYVMIVEEAHNFARQNTEKGAAVSRSTIEKVAREGRKFGASLCLISQRPVQLSTTALSQCNTFFIMRMTNPYDLKHVQESCESIDADTAGQITTLKVGEGIVIGEAVNYPTFLKVRNRTTKNIGLGKSFSDIAKSYEENQGLAEKIKDEDLDAFL